MAATANDKYDYVYQYDALQRLKNAQAGTYNSGSITSRQFEQDWTLDALGNWGTFQERDTDTGGTWDLTQQRNHSAANELGSFITSSWAQPAHDAAGNMTTMPQPHAPTSSYAVKYDAWNRLIEVKSGSNVVQKNEYDGLNRRIVKEAYSGGSLAETRHYYYNDRWQVVEERVGTTGASARVDAQWLYHPDYVDSVALRYWDSDQTGGPDAYHYYLQDANYNVTALVNGDSGSGNLGKVVERYAYSPYGEVRVLNGASDADGAVTDWSDDANNASDVKNVVLYTGRERDSETGLQLNRNRFYHVQLGRWVSRDPDQYVDSWNLYLYAKANSLLLIDPLGKDAQFDQCMHDALVAFLTCSAAVGSAYLLCLEACSKWACIYPGWCLPCVLACTAAGALGVAYCLARYETDSEKCKDDFRKRCPPVPRPQA